MSNKLIFDFKSFLLPGLNPQSLESLSQSLLSHSMLYIGVITLVAVIWEHVTGSDHSYINLLKRVILVYFFALIGPGILEAGVDMTMNLSNEIISKHASNSQLLLMFTHEKDELWIRVIKNIGLSIHNPLVAVIWALCWMAIFAVGHIYTLVYKLTYIAIPLSCIISIFPPTKDAVWGTIKSICWCFITPIVCALVLAIIGLDNFDPDKFSGSINGLIQTLIYCVTIFYIPALGTAFLTSKGFQSAGEQLSGMMASSAITLGKYHFLKTMTAGIGLLPEMGKGVSSLFKRTPIETGKNLFTPLAPLNLPIQREHLKARQDLAKGFDFSKASFTVPQKEFDPVLGKITQSAPVSPLTKSTVPRLGTKEGVTPNFHQTHPSVPSLAPFNIPIQRGHLASRQDFAKGFDFSKASFTVPYKNADLAYGVVKKTNSNPALTKTSYPTVDEIRKNPELMNDWHSTSNKNASIKRDNHPSSQLRGKVETREEDQKSIRKKGTYQYNEKYWKRITPEHRENIRKRYDIHGEKPNEKQIYQSRY